jgi:hypothetical protein
MTSPTAANISAWLVRDGVEERVAIMQDYL